MTNSKDSVPSQKSMYLGHCLKNNFWFATFCPFGQIEWLPFFKKLANHAKRCTGKYWEWEVYMMLDFDGI